MGSGFKANLHELFCSGVFAGHPTRQSLECFLGFAKGDQLTSCGTFLSYDLENNAISCGLGLLLGLSGDVRFHPTKAIDYLMLRVGVTSNGSTGRSSLGGGVARLIYRGSLGMNKIKILAHTGSSSVCLPERAGTHFAWVYHKSTCIGILSIA